MAICAAPGPAVAYTCSITATNIAFGSVDPLPGSAVDVTATLNLSCTQAPRNRMVRNCVSINGGSAHDATSREMTGPGALRFQLYSNSGYTTPWGSWPLGLYGGGYSWDVLSTGTTLTASTTVYAQILAGQQSAAPGAYSSTLTLYFTYQNNNTTACPFTGQGNATTTFTATATILPSCAVSAANLNFGTVGTLAGNIDATNSVSPTCTNGTPYNVGLNQGLNGSSVTTRKMKAGAALVGYSLFRDSGRTLNWGNTVGADTVAGAGTGSAQSLTVYGRIPPQTTPAPGVYTDTIVVTVTY